MPKHDNNAAFEITCPCCNAVLKIDPSTRAVIAHTAAVKPKMFNDMEEAARAMKEQDTPPRFHLQAVGGESKGYSAELLEKKFQEAVPPS